MHGESHGDDFFIRAAVRECGATMMRRLKTGLVFGSNLRCLLTQKSLHVDFQLHRIHFLCHVYPK